jgi:hypothetical protein
VICWRPAGGGEQRELVGVAGARVATIGKDGPTGTFQEEADGELPW